MQRMTFSMNLSAEKYQRYYLGSAKAVIVQADDGRTLRFPISAIQKYVTHDGVQGHFEIIFDDNNKMTALNRLG
ncbi:MAG: DUF2835 domain-containing protein [Gammaproteobacteria bacterium]|nr:DUF2835 domain-containing protein [Gammaproteobacteria bacterium]